MARNYDLHQSGSEVQKRIDQVVVTQQELSSEVQARISGDASVVDACEQYADAAVQAEKQRALAAEANRYTKQETYNKQELNNMITTPDVEYVTVADIGDLPEQGESDTLYRVSNYDGEAGVADPTKYSLYAWNGTQYELLSVRTEIGEVFDISAYHNGSTYTGISNALGVDGVNVPEGVRKGGMSVKFVLDSSQKYVQFMLSNKVWSAIAGDWKEEGSVYANNGSGNMDFEVTDSEGNALIRCRNGHIRTKKFNSAELTPHPVDVRDSVIPSDLDICDEAGNVIARFRDGGIKTKRFDSSTYGSITMTAGKYIDCTNGEEVESNSHKCTDFVQIRPCQKFHIPMFGVAELSTIGLAFYDEQKQFIHGIPYPYTAPGGYNMERYVAPASAMYVRFSLLVNQKAYVHDDSTFPVAPLFRIYKKAACPMNWKGGFKAKMNFGNGIIIASSGNYKHGGVNDDIFIYRSTDWGSTWTLMGNATEDLGLQEGIYYGDHDGNGLAILGSGDLSRHYLLKITNYGENWESDYEVILNKAQMDSITGLTTTACECVVYCNNSTFRALTNADSYQTANAVIESTDNGLTWHALSSQYPLRASVRSLFRDSKGILWAAGMKGQTGVWKSSDNGLNWERKTSFLAFQTIIEFGGNLYSGAMNNNSSEAYVYRSTDGGNTWMKVLTVPKEDWSNIYHRAFIPYGNMLAAVFCAGEGSVSLDTDFYVTNDNGRSWGRLSQGRTGCFDGGLVNNIMQFGDIVLLNCNAGLFTV